MTDFTTVAKVGAIPEGRGECFTVNGRLIAVFRENDEYFAIDDVCPHMGAQLSGGCVQEGVVYCPWHLWRFDIRDGTWRDNPRVKIDSFAVRIQGQEIQVRVPPKPPRAAVQPTAPPSQEPTAPPAQPGPEVTSED